MLVCMWIGNKCVSIHHLFLQAGRKLFRARITRKVIAHGAEVGGLCLCKYPGSRNVEGRRAYRLGQKSDHHCSGAEFKIIYKKSLSALFPY